VRTPGIIETVEDSQKLATYESGEDFVVTEAAEELDLRC
jgi:hypothetical protein